MPHFKIIRENDRVIMADVVEPEDGRSTNERRLSALEEARRARKNLDAEERADESAKALEAEEFHCQECDFSSEHKTALLSHIRFKHSPESE